MKYLETYKIKSWFYENHIFVATAHSEWKIFWQVTSTNHKISIEEWDLWDVATEQDVKDYNDFLQETFPVLFPKQSQIVQPPKQEIVWK